MISHIARQVSTSGRVNFIATGTFVACFFMSSRTASSCAGESSIQQVSIRLNTWSSPDPSTFATHQMQRSGMEQTCAFRSLETVRYLIGFLNEEVAPFRISCISSERFLSSKTIAVPGTMSSM